MLRFLTVILVITWAGCSTGQHKAGQGSGLKSDHDKSIRSTTPNRPPPETSRMLASNSLTQNGIQHLKRGDFDRAIRIFEQAVGLNPGDGPGYYYLAESWIGKKNFTMASKFNKLAGLYLGKNPLWSSRIMAQNRKIEKNR